MKRIGLTGMSGSGKSYVSGIFAGMGIPVINSDAVVHELYSEEGPLGAVLARLFGREVLLKSGEVDRKVLSEIVFHDREKLALLNGAVHPYVIERCLSLADHYAKAGKEALLIEAPQLFEAGLDKECDFVVAVVSDPARCVERIVLRDGISPEKAKLRLANQHDEAFFRKHCDFCIENNEDDSLKAQVAGILKSMGLLP